MAQRASFPILAANFFKEGHSLLKGFQATASFSISKEFRLGVIGLTVHHPEIYLLFGLETPEFIGSAREWLGKLKDNGRGPVVVLSHLGLREDRLLAQALPEIDVIIGGHSHSLLESGENVNGVLIAQAGEYARYLGRVDLLVDENSGKVLEKNASVIEVPGTTPLDPLVQTAIQQAENEARQFMSQPVGRLDEALDHHFFVECGIVDLAADAIRERMGAEMGLLTGGLFQQGLPEGIVTLLDLDTACFTTANPNFSRVRGQQIRDALERALDPEFMHTYEKGLRGAPVGLPAISGMEVNFDPNGPDGGRIKQIIIQGMPLEADRNYSLAHTDAEVMHLINPFGILELEDGQLIHEEVPTILREAIADYLQAHSPTPRPVGDRWRLSSAPVPGMPTG